jgi:large subunit ribosomal protein L25
MVPGIVYGGSSDNIPVTLDPKDLFKLLRSHAGRNTIMNLEIEGAAADNVILKDWQVDPVTEAILHADFHRIAMDQALRVTVRIVTRGVPYGVKTEGGLLEAVTREVEVECLPTNIPDEISCDVTELHLHDSIRVRDLTVGEDFEILAEPDQVVVHVVSVKEEVEEVDEAEEEGVEVAEGEGEAGAEAGDKDKEDGD